jgi:hypothetical protein
MKNNFTLLISLFLFVAGSSLAQVSFTNTNSRLSNASFHSGCPVAIADWNGDGLDDIIRLDEGHDCFVEVQRISAILAVVPAGPGRWPSAISIITVIWILSRAEVVRR